MAINDASYDLLDLEARAFAKTGPDLGVPLNGSAAFSVAAWVKLDGLCSGASILSKDGVFDFGISGDQLLLSIAGFPPLESNPRKQPLDHLAWHYLAATFSEGEARLYIDGVFNAMQATSGSGSSNQNPFLIGKGLQAHVRSLRVYKVALTPDAVMANMFEPPEAGTLAADFDFSQTPPVDKGPGKLPITLEEGARMIRSTPALSLSGTAFAEPLSEEEVNPGGGQVDPYTVQAWVYVEPDAPPEQAIFVNSDLESATGMALYLEEDEAAKAFRVISQRGSVMDEDSLVSTTVVEKGTWTNVATTFDGTNLTIYVNGQPAGSGPFGPIPLESRAGRLMIGAALSLGQPFGVMPLQGYVSRLEVWDVALTAADVAAYVAAMPPMHAAGLIACYDFTSRQARNMLDAHPVGLADGAGIAEQVQPAISAGPSPTTWPPAEPAPELDEETIRALRETLEPIDPLLAADLEAAMESDAAAFEGSPEDQELIRRAWREGIEQVQEDPLQARFLVTSHVVDGEHVLLCHRRGETHVALRIGVDEVDDCTLWMIKLVFIAVAGLLDALVGLKAALKPGALNYIRQLLNRPDVSAVLSRGSKINGAGILSLAVILYEAGALKELVKLMVELGFWAILRVAAKLVAKIFGVGIAETIASLAATAIAFIIEFTNKPASCSPPPTVELSALKFDFSSDKSAADALSIRRNHSTSLGGLQWRKGMTKPEESPAAYAISQVSGKPVTLQASFVLGGSGSGSSAQVKAEGGGILGAVDPFTVKFKNGKSDPEFVPVTLNHHTLAGAGIQRQDVEWNWFYQLDGGSWTPLATSAHRIYVVLAEPTAPWTQSPNPSDDQLPWTEVLDLACQWAAGKTLPTDAAAAITTKVNEAVGLSYEYAAGASKYTQFSGSQLVFLCTEFIEFLQGKGGAGPLVNCTDCASIVTTFSNIVGCNVFASRMSPDPGVGGGFLLNMIKGIGSSSWAYPFSNQKFSYHEVAWTGAGSYPNPLFDACLKVDRGNEPWNWSNPTAPSHVPAIALNMPFTSLDMSPGLPLQPPFEADSYRERLAANTTGGIDACKPQGPQERSSSGRRMVL